jgi:recombination protein RecA
LREFLAHNDDVQEELMMKLREKLLEAETDQELKDETTDGEPTQESIPPDSTDEEVIAAAEACT